MKNHQVLYKAEAIARRVRKLGQEISRDFRGQTLDVVAVLDSGYIFAADLVRAVTVPVRTHFIRSQIQDIVDPSTGKERKEIFYTPEVEAGERNVLLVQGILQSGVTTEFLLRRIGLHSPRVVKTVVCVDKPGERKVSLEPDYAAFRLASNDMVVGYGLSWDGLDSNLPYLGSPTAVRKKAGTRRARTKKAAGKARKKGKKKGKRK